MVCGDSHTATHGALGALAFGIGASEVAHVLATQTLWQSKPKNMRVTVDGALGPGVYAKDVILAIIAKIGAAGGAGHVIEYAGSARSARCHRGAAHRLQHVDRGRRPRRHGRAGRHNLRISARPALRAQGRDWDRALGAWRSLAERCRSARSTARSRSMRRRSRRW